MPITHTNRRGDVYYLHQGRTKTGKPRYHFSKKKSGDDLAESIPHGYEIYEKPNAQVFLRPIPPQVVTAAEVAQVGRAVRELGRIPQPIIDVEDRSIVVYLPSSDRRELEQTVRELRSPFHPRSVEQLVLDMERRGNYSPMMRFTLVDEPQRRFRTERWCFRGRIDGWITLLDGLGELGGLLAKYCPHLGEESFFDLM
jgi:hypothetical protein